MGFLLGRIITMKAKTILLTVLLLCSFTFFSPMAQAGWIDDLGQWIDEMKEKLWPTPTPKPQYGPPNPNLEPKVWPQEIIDAFNNGKENFQPTPPELRPPPEPLGPPHPNPELGWDEVDEESNDEPSYDHEIEEIPDYVGSGWASLGTPQPGKTGYILAEDLAVLGVANQANPPKPKQLGYILAEDLAVPSVGVRANPKGSDKGPLMTAAETGDNTGIFTAFDNLKAGAGFGTLSAGANTPTAALDAAPQGRDLATGAGVLNTSAQADKGAECEHLE
jgi:hypothetical protein